MFKVGDIVSLSLSHNELSDIEADYLSERKGQKIIDQHFLAFEDPNTVWEIVLVPEKDTYEIKSKNISPFCCFHGHNLKLLNKV